MITFKQILIVDLIALATILVVGGIIYLAI